MKIIVVPCTIIVYGTSNRPQKEMGNYLGPTVRDPYSQVEQAVVLLGSG